MTKWFLSRKTLKSTLTEMVFLLKLNSWQSGMVTLLFNITNRLNVKVCVL